MSDDLITFYHAAPSRGSIVHWMLEEVAAPYRIELLDLNQGQQKEPGYLADQPDGQGADDRASGRRDHRGRGDLLLSRRRLPGRGPGARRSATRSAAPTCAGCSSSPPASSPRSSTGCWSARRARRGALGYGDFDTTMDVVARAVTPGPYLLGERFSTADVLIGSALRWGMMVGSVPQRPEFAAYVERLDARPALQRAQAKDQELAGSRGAA